MTIDVTAIATLRPCAHPHVSLASRHSRCFDGFRRRVNEPSTVRPAHRLLGPHYQQPDFLSEHAHAADRIVVEDRSRHRTRVTVSAPRSSPPAKTGCAHASVQAQRLGERAEVQRCVCAADCIPVCGNPSRDARSDRGRRMRSSRSGRRVSRGRRSTCRLSRSTSKRHASAVPIPKRALEMCTDSHPEDTGRRRFQHVQRAFPIVADAREAGHHAAADVRRVDRTRVICSNVGISSTNFSTTAGS